MIKTCLILIMILSFDSKISLCSDSVNDLIIEGNQQLSKGNYQEAIHLFNEVLHSDSKNYLAFYGKGLSYEKLYFLDTALFNYRKAIYYKDDFAQAFYRSGIIKYNFKLFSQALKDFEKVTKLNPNNLEALLYTANCYEKMGFFIGASDLYKNLANHSTSHKEFMLKSCITRIGNGEYKATINHFDSLLIKYPQYDSAYYYRGICKMKAGMLEPAINDFSLAINLHQSFIEAYIYRGVAKQAISKIAKDENDDLNIWKKIQPDFIENELDKAYNCYFDSLYYEAIEHFNFVIATDSSRADAIFSLAMCYYRMKNYMQALHFVDMVLDKSPTNIEAELLKAKIFLGYKKEIIRSTIGRELIVTISSYDIFKGRVLAIISQAMENALNSMSFYGGMNLYDSVLTSTDKLLKLDSNSFDVHLIRAEAYASRKQDSIAEHHFSKAIELSNEPESYFKRGLFYLKQKDYSKSLDDFIKAYELNYQTLEIKVLKILLYEITERDPFRSAHLSSIFDDELLNASANYLYGYYLLEYLGDSHTAIKYFDKAIELDPYYYDAHLYKELAKKQK